MIHCIRCKRQGIQDCYQLKPVQYDVYIGNKNYYISYVDILDDEYSIKNKSLRDNTEETKEFNKLLNHGDAKEKGLISIVFFCKTCQKCCRNSTYRSKEILTSMLSESIL